MQGEVESPAEDEAAQRLAALVSPAAIDRILADAKASETPLDGPDGVLNQLSKYYSRSFTKGYRSWPSVADLDRQETTQSDDRGLTRAGTTRM
jgi:hypothetical protein